MPSKKVWWILIGVGAIIVGLIVWGITDTPDRSAGTGITYYYGDGCPHCKAVQEYLDRERVSEKVPFEKKEVWKNRANALEMERMARICDVKREGMGVPFVFDGETKRCYVGEPDVIGFFEEKAKTSAVDGTK